MLDDEENTYTLAGQEAIDLWLRGEGEWNQWTKDIQRANVDFVGVDFGVLKKKHQLDNISFSRFRFPIGNVNFNRAVFGEGPVSFISAVFGKGNVSFSGTDFGKGGVNFTSADFGEGNVNFSNTNFGGGEVTFSHIKTNNGIFRLVSKESLNCVSLDFSESTIGGVLDMYSLVSPTVLNLCHTRLAYPLDLDGTNIDFRKEYHYLRFHRAINPYDSTSFRRLKKLAKESDDHERALDFYAKEMRSAYWHSITGSKLALYYLYDWISDYGRSILKPFLGLIVTAWIYTGVYLAFAVKNGGGCWDALKFSAGHILPIYPGARESRPMMIDVLFGKDFSCAPSWMPIVPISQYILSSVLLFLIGLALRNRFRI